MRPGMTVGLLLGVLLHGSAAAEDPPALEEGIRLLASPDWKERIRGIESLETLPGDPRAARAAVKALADPDWGVILRAEAALGKIGNEESRDPLIRLAVEGEIRWIRDGAVSALGGKEAKASAARLLAAARGVREAETQVRAIEAAGALGAAEHMTDLSGFAHSREPAVAAAALRAAGRIAGRDPRAEREAIDLLQSALAQRGDRRLFQAYAATVEGLGGIPSKEAAALLLGELAQAPDDDPYVPERIARGLARAGREGVGSTVNGNLSIEKDPAPLRRLARLAARNGIREARPGLERILANPDERVRSEACRALGILGDPESSRAVRPLLQDRSAFVRVEAVGALARLLPRPEFRALGADLAKDRDELVRLQWIVEVGDRRDPADIDALAPFLGDASWRVASAALATTGTLGAGPDLPRVAPSSTHRDWRIRAAAFEAMGRLRAKEAIPLLAAALKDRDPVVRGVCLADLKILTKQDLPPDPAAWTAWWEANGMALDIVKRSRRDAATIEKELKEEDRYGKQFYGKRGVEVLQKARILVVKGAWDHVERVLAHLKIPATALRAQELKDAGLNPNQVVLVNCEGNLDAGSAERLQWFVNVGGYCMTTDWALTKAVRICFPGYADQSPGANTGNDVVVVEEGLPGHPHTAGIFEGVPAMKWWLEIQAFPIRILYPERVEVLVDSAEMKRKYGTSSMGLEFRWGLGKVQHSVSHFALQEEGMSQARGERPRMIFAADHLGLSLDAIREIAARGGFKGSLNEETMKEIAPDYSMFRLIVNFVGEKSRWVEDLWERAAATVRACPAAAGAPARPAPPPGSGRRGTPRRCPAW